MSGKFVLILSFVAALLAPGTAETADQTRKLLRYVPDSANAIGVIHVEHILGSRRAQREGWADKQKDKFLAGAAVVPPWASTCVYASRLQLQVPREEWNVVLLAIPGNIDLNQVARHENGQIESLGGVSVVRGQRDAYFAALAPGVLGSRSPAFRADTARWIRSTASATDSQVSPYLKHAADSPADIVLAVDLQDAIDPQLAQQRMRELQNVKLDDATIASLVSLVQSLEGIRLEVVVGNTTDAKLYVDFGAPAGQNESNVAAVAREVLRHHGLDLPELAKSVARSDGNSVIISTTLSDESLRKILSLLVAPNPPQQVATTDSTTTPAPSAPANSNEATAAASRDYFAAVDKALRDVSRPSWSNENSGTEAWLERYAKKIDSLPINNVDPNLTAYGASVSAKLRALAASLRGVDIDLDAQENTITYETHYDPGWSYVSWWGAVGGRPPSYNVTSNVQQVREKQANIIASGTDKRQQLWQMIDQDRNAIRQKMQQTYGGDFGNS